VRWAGCSLAQSSQLAVPFQQLPGAELIRTTFAFICCAFAGLAFWFGIEGWIESSPRFRLFAAIVLACLVFAIGHQIRQRIHKRRS
jgi:hypothetical protein